jgi:protoporphyrinogen IX oxidase
MLWLKAFHVVAVVAWFAGLLYLPRLFVYHADAADAVGIERFEIMERRLFTITTIGALAAVGLGLAMIVSAPAYLAAGWLHVKMVLVLLVLGYHAWCFKLMRDFSQRRNTRSARWFRAFNEIPTLLLIAIVVLAVVKPF